MILKYWLSIFLLFTSLYASSSVAEKTIYGTITEIKAFGSQAYIYVEGINDPNACGNSSMVRFYWSTEQADKIWSMLLAAQMAGKQVAFDGQCSSGYLSVSQLYLKS